MTRVNKKSRKIESLQALRAIAFIGIFLSHANAPYKWPALGVSVFFVLSGFLMAYRHKEDDLDYSIKGRTHFSLSRIKKLYPLHILTMIFGILLALAFSINAGFTLKSLFVLIGEIVLNIFLLQTWVPSHTVNVSLNGVAWYLSVTMFLYFMFPPIQRYIKRKKISTLWIICFLILVLQIISCLPWIHFLGTDSPIYKWFMYCFPVFRLGDFFVGCTLGKQYAESKNTNVSCTFMTIVEIIMTIVPFAFYSWLKIEQDNILLLSLHNWTTVFIPIAAVWVYLFAQNKGVICRFLSNRVFIFLGNISAYMFLIHFVLTRYINAAFRFLDIELPMHIKLAIIFAEYIMTIILSLLYMKIRGEKVKI